jgi:hypothetical protein
MDRKTAISRANEQLVNDRDATSMLNREGWVRIMPRQDVPAYKHDLEPTMSPNYIVTFTLELHGSLNCRLMAEYQGTKEFVA